MDKYGYDAKRAEKTIKETNRIRSKHYNFFTGRIWGDRRNYDLLLNTDSFTAEECVELIAEAARKKKT